MLMMGIKRRPSGGCLHAVGRRAARWGYKQFEIEIFQRAVSPCNIEYARWMSLVAMRLLRLEVAAPGEVCGNTLVSPFTGCSMYHHLSVYPAQISQFPGSFRYAVQTYGPGRWQPKTGHTPRALLVQSVSLGGRKV